MGATICCRGLKFEMQGRQIRIVKLAGRANSSNVALDEDLWITQSSCYCRWPALSWAFFYGRGWLTSASLCLFVSVSLLLLATKVPRALFLTLSGVQIALFLPFLFAYTGGM
jgi:hypothetical protein